LVQNNRAYARSIIPKEVFDAAFQTTTSTTGIAMAISLSTLNRKQLADLMNKARAREVALAKEEIARVRKKVDALLKSEGYTFAEVYGARRGKRGKVAPKYRNPANPAETWSGRGKRPRWFSAALRAGKKDRDLLIK
jgi:DNA-binding protein H-NS